jgi:O-antigen ligase
MMRLFLIGVVVLALSIYAWRDWYKSLCGLIVLMAVVEHPDMPKTILGIQGVNPWNIVFVSVVLAWAASRAREGLVWDMPRHVGALLLLQLGVVLVGFARMVVNPHGLEDVTTGTLISEYLINTLKWIVPGLLLFDGCRSRSRFTLAVISVLAVYLLLALQVIRWMPPGEALSGDMLSARSAKILLNEVGYHRVNLSMLLAGASWALLAALPMARRRSQQALFLGAGLVVVYAQALTAGRTGYVTWAVLGLFLGLVRWRKYLFLAPVVAGLVTLVVPGAVERISQGFAEEDRDGGSPLVRPDLRIVPGGADQPDAYTITSGRNVAWPYVIEKIGESPIFGFGRRAMERTGIAAFLWEEFNESFPHPHNAYLELLLDNGWIGFLLVLPFYVVVVGYGVSLFRDRRSPVFTAIGGVTCSLVLALLVASVGSQSFYPREGSVGMWCVIGLALRVVVERARAEARMENTAARPWWAVAGGDEAPRGGGERDVPSRTLDAVLWARPA